VPNIGIKLEVSRLRLPHGAPRKVGDITYAPAVSNVARGDGIAWNAAAPFTLVFRERTPFDEAVLHSEPTGESHAVRTNVRADAPPGIYYYAVGIATPDGVFVDAGCPAVIVH
jgi:hypothetical protein